MLWAKCDPQGRVRAFNRASMRCHSDMRDTRGMWGDVTIRRFALDSKQHDMYTMSAYVGSASGAAGLAALTALAALVPNPTLNALHARLSPYPYPNPNPYPYPNANPNPFPNPYPGSGAGSDGGEEPSAGYGRRRRCGQGPSG